MINYIITVNDEFLELKKLLSILNDNLDGDEEVIIQHDFKDTKIHNEIKNFIQELSNNFKVKIKYIQYPFSGNFSDFKNNLINEVNPKLKWIVHFDADEYPSKYLISNIKEILINSEDVDIISVPRINIVNGITEEYIKKWKWRVTYDKDYNALINYPDYQQRIWKNNKNIKFVGKVHERLYSYNLIIAELPQLTEYSYFHIKNIDKQIKQNNLYDSL